MTRFALALPVIALLLQRRLLNVTEPPLRLGGREGDRSVARHRIELPGPPKGLGGAGAGGGVAVAGRVQRSFVLGSDCAASARLRVQRGRDSTDHHQHVAAEHRQYAQRHSRANHRRPHAPGGRRALTTIAPGG